MRYLLISVPILSGTLLSIRDKINIQKVYVRCTETEKLEKHFENSYLSIEMTDNIKKIATCNYDVALRH